MKKVFVLLCAISLCFGLSGIANAALVDQLNGTILDTTNKLLWWQDLTDFTWMTYDEQITEIGKLGVEWHMASEDEMSALFDTYDFDAVRAVFEPTYYGPTIEFIGRYNLEVEYKDDYHYVCQYFKNTIYGYVNNNMYIDTYWDDTTPPFAGAWVVANPVPIPPAFWLLGSGLLGIVGVRRRFKR